MLDKLQSSTVEKRPQNPRVVHIDSESASALIEALSSETARQIMASLHEQPQPPSRIASSVDTSLSNINYHLDNLQQAGLITDVDTWYSEKGNEMTVYAPTEDPLVFTGTEDRSSRIKSLLQQVGAAVVVLLATSFLVQWFVSEVLVTSQRAAVLRKATSAGGIGGTNLAPIPSGLLFFTGGTFVLAITVLVWHISRENH